MLDALWMMSYLAVGLAALLPSMRGLTEQQAAEKEDGSSRAMLGLLVATAVLAVTNVTDEATLGVPLLGEAAEIMLVGLLFLRAYEAGRREARHERRIAALLANASDALTVVGKDGRILLSNAAAARVIGGPGEQSAGQSIQDFLKLLHPDDKAMGAQRLASVLATPGAREHGEVRVRNDVGEYRWLNVTAVNRVDDPVVGGVVMTFQDVTEQRASQQRLQRLGMAIEQTSEAVIIANADADIEYVNPAFERMSGYTAAEVLGRNPRLLQSGRQPPAFYRAMWETLTAGRPWVCDFINRRKDGSEYQVAAIVSGIREPDGSLNGFVGVSRDVSVERRGEAHAAQLARERALIAETIRGIDTRASAETIADTICGQVAGLPGAATAGLVIFELDGRAMPYGLVTSTGNRVTLRHLPKQRVAEMRERAARGPWIEAWQAQPTHPYNGLLAELGVRAIAYAPIRDATNLIGYMLLSSADANAQETLSSALPAMIEFADIAGTLIGPKVAERTSAEQVRQRVASIIDKSAFVPYFQPIVDLVANRVVGYEALTRFDSGIGPEDQFAEATAAGMGKQLELAVVQKAMIAAASMPAGRWLNINASPALIAGGNGFLELVLDADRALVVEMTEHEEIVDYAQFRAAVSRLGPNVRLAVDDAGAGFASLRHILELQPSFVKLDRALISHIDQDRARQALVAGMKHFAKDAGFWIIAEGVETEAELLTLRALDIRYAQGYLLGRPQPTFSATATFAAID